jgi:predicted porin
MNKNTQLSVLAAAALLLVSGLAQAQSKVTLYGLMDVSAGSSKLAGGQSVKSVDSGKMTTSYFGMSGSEDLGGGLSAVFTLDSFLRADAGKGGRSDTDNFWARSAFVGLSSKDLGTLRLGRNTTQLFVQTLLFNAFGDSFGYSPSIRHYYNAGSGVSTGALTGDSGWSDSVLYLSPKFGGFTGGLFFAAGEGAGGRNWGANAAYGQGAFAISATYQNVAKDSSTTAAVANTKTWQLGSSFDMGVVKLFGQYGQVDNTTTGRDYKITAAGAAVPIGNGKILAQYGQLSASAGADRKTFSFGYDHYLSKRTDVYAVAMSDKVDGLSGGNSYSLGIRHRF